MIAIHLPIIEIKSVNRLRRSIVLILENCLCRSNIHILLGMFQEHVREAQRLSNLLICLLNLQIPL
jgi:hypothetical protein